MNAPTSLALGLTMFVEAVGYGMVAPTLPFMAQRSGASESEIGLLVGLYAGAGLLGSLPLAALGARYGRRLLILLGLAAVTLASVGFVAATGYAWLLAIRFVQGIGATAIWVGALTLAGDLSRDDSMASSLAWITGSWSLGFVVGPVIGGLGQSLSFPFLLYAGLSAAALLLAWWILPEAPASGERSRLRDLVGVLGKRSVWQSASVTFSLAFFFAAAETFLPLMAAESGVSRAHIGLLFAIAGTPAILLPRLVGALADRIGDIRSLLGGLAYAALLSLLFVRLFGLLPHWLLFLLLGVVDVVLYVPAVALLQRGRSHRERAFATASHSYAFSAGFFTGPLLGGVAAALGGYTALFAMVGAVMIACAALLLAQGSAEPSPARAPGQVGPVEDGRPSS